MYTVAPIECGELKALEAHNCGWLLDVGFFVGCEPRITTKEKPVLGFEPRIFRLLSERFAN